MHDVTFPIDHDVPVVSVLDLEDIACDRICRHRLNEVQSGFLEGSGVGAAVFVNEITIKVIDLGSTHFIPGCRVGHHIDHTTLFGSRFERGISVRTKTTYTWCCSGNSIRKQVEYQSRFHENVLEHGDDLECENVLAAIISHFENGRLPNFVLYFLALKRVPTVCGLRCVVFGFSVFYLLLSYFECGHEGSLQKGRVRRGDRRGDSTSWGFRRTCLRMTLQRSARLLVDVNHYAVRVRRQVHSDFHLDFRHFFVDFRLWRGEIMSTFSNCRLELRKLTFFSGLLFLINGLSLPEIDVTSLKKLNSRS